MWLVVNMIDLYLNLFYFVRNILTTHLLINYDAVPVVFAPIAGLASIKASCNWMWPAKVQEDLESNEDAHVRLCFLKIS